MCTPHMTIRSGAHALRVATLMGHTAFQASHVICCSGHCVPAAAAMAVTLSGTYAGVVVSAWLVTVLPAVVTLHGVGLLPGCGWEAPHCCCCLRW